MAGVPCASSELISPRRPSDYVAGIGAAARRNDLVIAASFLLAEAVVQAAQQNPRARFVLVDPIVPPVPLQNLLVLSVRRDQAAFLAGALGAMLSRSGHIAGIYGPGGADDQVMRAAFEQGARIQDAGMVVLGAYQPANAGQSIDDPAWGAAQAARFVDQHADVIFASGGPTGLGAVAGAERAGIDCIGLDLDVTLPAPRCAVASIDIDLSTAMTTLIERVHSHWRGGSMPLGLREGAVRLRLFGPALTPQIVSAIDRLTGRLTDGSVSSVG